MRISKKGLLVYICSIPISYHRNLHTTHEPVRWTPRSRSEPITRYALLQKKVNDAESPILQCVYNYLYSGKDSLQSKVLSLCKSHLDLFLLPEILVVVGPRVVI